MTIRSETLEGDHGLLGPRWLRLYLESDKKGDSHISIIETTI